jgi:hypothetical protein
MLTSALGGGGWLTSHSGLFTTGKPQISIGYEDGLALGTV